MLITLALVASSYAAPAAVTAQAVMIDPEISGDFVLDETQLWQYNRDTAASLFTNQWVSTSSRCEGSGCPEDGYTCSVTAPAVPAVNPGKTSAAVGSNTCTFWEGGELGGSTYQQHQNAEATCTKTTTTTTTSCDKTACTGVLIKGKYTCSTAEKALTNCTPSTGGVDTTKYYYTSHTTTGTQTDTKTPQYHYTFNYAVSPVYPSVDPRTAWDMVNASSTEGSVTITGNVAAEQVVRKLGGNAPWTMKSSHGLLDADGTAKITSLYVRMDWTDADATTDADGNLDDVPYTTGDTALTWTLDGSSDFHFEPTATHGDATLPFTGMISDITDGQAANGAGLYDDFAGNDGEAAYRAVVDPVTYVLSMPSTYTVTMWGTVMSIDATAEEDFEVTELVHYYTGGVCGGL